MKKVIHYSILIIIFFICTIASKGQRIDYKGGYFEKVGNRWNEYRPQEKSGIHNYFNQYSEDNKWWYVDNGSCQLALPKDPPTNNIWIRFPGNKEWQYKYKATGIRYNNNSKNNSKPSTTRKSTTTASSNRSSNNNSGRTTCKTCNGTGVMVCPSCDGHGKHSACIFCGGSGRGYIPGSRCNSCGGDGVQKCPYCGNKGKRECMVCRGRGWYNSATLQSDTQFANEMSQELKRQRNENRQLRNKERQYQKQRHVCSVCGGTGIGNMDDKVTPDGIAPSNIKYKNKAGEKCPICGSRRYHAHFKCGGCRGSGR